MRQAITQLGAYMLALLEPVDMRKVDQEPNFQWEFISNMKRRFYLTLFVVCFASTTGVQAQIINTVAGTGALGHSGDGGPATAADLFYPSRVAVDRAGNLYLSDINPYVRKVDGAGIISNFAGNGTSGYLGDGGIATAAEIAVNGIAVDSSGNVYISNANSVRKISASGIITTIAGSSTAGFSGDGGPASAATLDGVFGIAVDDSGNVYVGDVNNFRVRKISPTGMISTYAGNGTSGNSGDGGMATAAQIQDPTGLAVDASGNLLIADNTSHVIRKVTVGGTISTVAGNGTAGYTGDGGMATAATLNNAVGVAVDALGNMFIADLNNNVVRKVTTAGTISTYVGNGTNGFSGDGGLANACELSQPWGLASDRFGTIYIADYQNSRVRRVTSSLTGVVQTPETSSVFFITPNPSSGTFSIIGHLESSADGTAEIQVCDVLGRVVFTGEARVVQGKIKTDLQIVTAINGLYILKINFVKQTSIFRIEIQ